MQLSNIKNVYSCPGQWLSWLKRHPIHQKVVGSIPGQGTFLGCGFDPQMGCVQVCNWLVFLTLMFSLHPRPHPVFPFLSQINLKTTFLGED